MHVIQQIAAKVSPAAVSTLLCGAALAMLLATGTATVTCGTTSVAEALRAAYTAHAVVLGACVFAAGGVAAVLLYSIAAFHPRTRVAVPRITVARTMREIVWALIPVAIVIGCALPSITGFVAVGEHAQSEFLAGQTVYQCRVS